MVGSHISNNDWVGLLRSEGGTDTSTGALWSSTEPSALYGPFHPVGRAGMGRVSHIKVELIQSTGQTYTNNKQQCFSDKRDGHLFIWGSYFLEIAIFVFAWSLILLFFLLEQLKLLLLMLHPSETALLYTSPRTCTTPQAVSFVLCICFEVDNEGTVFFSVQDMLSTLWVSASNIPLCWCCINPFPKCSGFVGLDAFMSPFFHSYFSDYEWVIS